MLILRRYSRRVAAVALGLFVCLVCLSFSTPNDWIVRRLPDGSIDFNYVTNIIITKNAKQSKRVSKAEDLHGISVNQIRKYQTFATEINESAATSSSDKENQTTSQTISTQNTTKMHQEKVDKNYPTTYVGPKGWAYRGARYMRCRVQTVGCYEAAPEQDISGIYLIASSSPNMTDWHCIYLCTKGRLSTYAGLRNGNECHCVKKVQYLINLEESDKCNVPCAGDASLNCGGLEGVTMVYRLLGECVKEPLISDVVTGSSILGCHKKPSNLHLQMERHRIVGEQLPGKCVLRCEKAGLTLAIPVHPTTCLCGHTTPNFDLQYPVDHSYCLEYKKNYVMVYRTWAEDRRCGNKRFLKKGEKKRSIVLATFPGSGNTWMRHLIETSTGIFTGSFYDDHTMVQGGYLGELLPVDSDKVMVVKSHRWEDLTGRYYKAAIHAYRNPYDAFLSEYNRRKAGSHTREVDSFNVEDLANLVKKGHMRKWHKMTRLALSSDMYSLVFSYEDLVKDPIKISEEMARFIWRDDIDEDDLQSRLLCLRLATTGEFKRKKKKLDIDPFTNEAKKIVNLDIDTLSHTLIEYGYDNLDHYKRALS